MGLFGITFVLDCPSIFLHAILTDLLAQKCRIFKSNLLPTYNFYTLLLSFMIFFSSYVLLLTNYFESVTEA